MAFVDPALMINYDATGFAVGYDSKRKVQVSYAKSERNKKKSLKTTPTKDEKGGISKLIIKFFLLVIKTHQHPLLQLPISSTFFFT